MGKPFYLTDEEPDELQMDPWGSTILLVEDNPGDARLVEHMLRRASSGFHVTHVPRIAEALDSLHTQDFSVILLDLSLPDGDGIDNVKEILSAAPSAPIVVLTGLEDQGVAIGAVQAGAQDYLIKGKVEPQALVQSMRYAIERKRTESRLAYLAHHDQLTGLVNRGFFLERLKRALDRSQRTEQRVAVMFLDLDHFKQINDTLGHDAGDTLLKEVAERLRASVRSWETVARMGGDEFTIVLENVEGPEGAETVANRILQAMSKPFRLAGGFRPVSTSIGVALAEPDDTVEKLLEKADASMYRSKRAGRNTYAIYSEAPPNEGTARLAEDLEGALEREEFELLYQPKLDMATRRVEGVEALLRWHHPRRGEVSPSELLPLLEKTGLMVPVGDWVLREACSQGRKWLSHENHLSLAVNISKDQFEQEGLPAMVADVLNDTGFPPQLLELELTETLLLKDPQHSQQILSQLHSLGVKISLDDFGARSSLTDLTQFAIDVLKIDRDLVSNLNQDPAHRAIVAAVVGLGQSLGIETVAEGVENAAERNILEQIGCETLQGFHLCLPMRADGLTVWLASNEADTADLIADPAASS